MAIRFPPAHEASPEGLLAIGGDLSVDTLTEAYLNGIFPWPISKTSPLTWFSPDPRGVLYTDEVHYSRSFERFLKKHKYEIKFNLDFKAVIDNCALTKRKHEAGTWITQEIINGYIRLFEAGKAYCVGIYNGDQIVGGLYGVCFGGIISGESMFHKESNASKLCVYSVMEKLKAQSIPFLDTQMVTPVIESFGGVEIDRDTYLEELSKLRRITLTRADIFNS